MTLTELARGLHISKGQASKLAARGMPTSSIDDAATWRRENLDPAWAKSLGANRVEPIHLRKPADDALSLVTRLALAAQKDLGTPQLNPHLSGLRQALRAVPFDRRDRVAMPVEIWDALCADVSAAIAQSEAQWWTPKPQTEVAADDDDALGRFWFSVAAGETLPGGG